MTMRHLLGPPLIALAALLFATILPVHAFALDDGPALVAPDFEMVSVVIPSFDLDAPEGVFESADVSMVLTLVVLPSASIAFDALRALRASPLDPLHSRHVLLREDLPIFVVDAHLDLRPDLHLLC